jgi:vanillate O-demethylase ferredoxin subunit
MGLLRDVRQAWQQEERPPADLRFETFGTSGNHPSRPYRVTVPRHGVTVEVPVGTSMLDALQDAGVEIMYDCLRGECGLCRVRILEADGFVDHRDVFLSSRQRAEGRHMCACVSRIAGPGVTIDC